MCTFSQLKWPSRFVSVRRLKEAHIIRTYDTTRRSPRRSHVLPGRLTPSQAGLILLYLVLLAAGIVSRVTVATAKDVKVKARTLSAQVASLDSRINDKFTVYVRTVDALNAVRAEIAQNKRQVKLADYALSVARRDLSTSVVASYKQQNVNLLDVFFSSANLSDLLDELNTAKRLSSQEADVIIHLKSLKKQIGNRQLSLQADAAASTRLVAQLGDQIKQIRLELASRRRLLAGARADIVKLAAKKRAKTTVTAGAYAGGAVSPDHGPWRSLIQSAAGKYGISANGMYRLMMIESGGNANSNSRGQYMGLFQYSASAWQGSWNPWRQASIFDGGAQIRATALAIHLGHGPAWWPGTYSWAFSQ